jgi:hypothetical protein
VRLFLSAGFGIRFRFAIASAKRRRHPVNDMAERENERSSCLLSWLKLAFGALRARAKRNSPLSSRSKDPGLKDWAELCKGRLSAVYVETEARVQNGNHRSAEMEVNHALFAQSFLTR